MTEIEGGLTTMMMSEFIERTKYEPSYEEYHHIEESYYEFPGNKDEFCKAWLKDKKDGHWDRELKLRMMLEEQKAKYEKKIAEQEETLEFYRPYFQKANDLQKKVERAERVLGHLKDIAERNFEALAN